MSKTKFLNKINFPTDLKQLNHSELKILKDELREEMINAVSETGGHLGAGLGVVELTVALHYIFDTPKDKIIWDVGHQSYPHKILTGRKDKIKTLRQGNGLSGFTKRLESEFDPFGAAHSSTSISAGLGIATANKLSNKSEEVVAVIGDGAMSAGMAYEAMNNAGASKTKMIVILNDNDMSIAKPVGAMKSYLAKIFSGKIYFNFRETLKLIFSSFSKRFSKKAGEAEDFLRSVVTGGTLFNSLGFYYIGPIDGHDLDVLLPVLKNAKESKHKGPILIHIKTQKGKGYSFAEKSEDKYHGVSKFNIKTGIQQKGDSKAPSYTKVYANTLVKHAENDSKIIGITAAMPSGTGMDIFGNKFPNRMFDVGIAEQHAVTFAAGLATEGYKPYASIYSTFLQRAYDQVVHDVAIQSLPVMINTSVEINDKPCAFRYPRGNGTGVQLPDISEKIQIGKAKVVREGKKIAILNFGARLNECLIAEENLRKKGVNASIVDARFAKPLDENLIWQLATNHEVIITIEEGSIGGFGAHVSNFLNDKNLLDSNLKFRSMILPDKFIDQDKPENMYKSAGLDALSIENKVLEVLNSKVIVKKIN